MIRFLGSHLVPSMLNQFSVEFDSFPQTLIEDYMLGSCQELRIKLIDKILPLPSVAHGLMVEDRLTVVRYDRRL